MAVALKIPEVGESITDVEIGQWLKAEGDLVERDEEVVVIETEKATVPVVAPQSGTISKILKQAGESARVGEIIGHIDEAQAAGERGRAGTTPRLPTQEPELRHGSQEIDSATDTRGSQEIESASDDEKTESVEPIQILPDAKKEVEIDQQSEEKEKLARDGRQESTARQPSRLKPVSVPNIAPARTLPSDEDSSEKSRTVRPTDSHRDEKTVPMTSLRRHIAERLVQAQQNAALLTTFNEIDMSAVIAVRERFRDDFEKKHSVKLGFMSFFVKASVEALKLVPEVNAEIRGDNIVYRNYFDIGVAVGGGRGLVVPVLRNAERLSFAEIERAIADWANRAKENRLKPDELAGGTFTISNGGIYGSLLSTPIVNPPQSGILGMHAIQDRPVARGGAVAIRPMMYVALTYDHRIVDGREAVTFLKHIKELVEEPSRILLEV